MSVEIPLEPSEELIFNERFQGERQSVPFVFAASKDEIFLSKERHFAKEVWRFQRVPRRNVKQISLIRDRPLFLWATAALIFSFGLILSILMIATLNNGESGIKHYSTLPIFITIFGIVMPFFAKDRKTLIIQMTDGQYKWKPKMQFDKVKREQIQNLQENILVICQSIGISVYKEI